MVAAFNSAAERIEDIAKKLNQTRRQPAAASRKAETVCHGIGMTGGGGRIRITLRGRGCEVRQSHIPRGLTILEGSCPWPGPWFRSHGAHLLM